MSGILKQKMHIILQPINFEHLRAWKLESVVTLLYGDDSKPLRTVQVDMLESYIYMEHQYYNYRVEGNTVYLWVVGR